MTKDEEEGGKHGTAKIVKANFIIQDRKLPGLLDCSQVNFTWVVILPQRNLGDFAGKGQVVCLLPY
jgi:hypothetical protein